MKISIYGQKFKEEHRQHLDRLLLKLESLGAEISMFQSYAEQTGHSFTSFLNYEDLEAIKTELMITLGGDGTILGASSIIKDLEIPILGVNLGRLGFLTSIEKNKIEKALDDWSEGNFKYDVRTMLKLDSNIPIFGEDVFALNDFTIHKRDTSSMIKVHTFINEEFLNSYWADGLIVSTPTGSTGYSLSCGGPIIFPDSGNFVITPVAPHNLNVRPVVLPDVSKISFRIEGRSENFLCTLDSRYETITADHELSVSKSNIITKLVQFKEKGFMDTIRQKLSWGFDTRNI